MTEPIARIEEALKSLGSEHQPPVGWEARVLAATTPRTRPKWLWFAAPAVALAVVALLVLPPSLQDEPLQLGYTVEARGAVVRGGSVHVGDIVTATATGGGPYRAVWVYRNDHLVVACPGAPQCRSSGDATIADVELTVLGTYTMIALTSKSPVPAPQGPIGTDLVNAEKAGATDTKHEQLTVR